MKQLMVLFLVLLVAILWFIRPAKSQVYQPTLEKATLEEINQLWKESAHALNGVNCSSCHQNTKTKALITKPNHDSCQSCHPQAVDTFLLGKHGIRLLEDLPPLTIALAHLPMQVSAQNKLMNCNACHNVHSVNTYQAAVNSCLTCHQDAHSLNYKDSPHAQLFQAEVILPRPSSKSVTCATCHLPRHKFERPDGTTWVGVNHNNTFTLKPRDRMVKDVCMNCHGLEFSYNSIFDDELVKANFNRPPTQDLETLKMIRVLEKKRSNNS
ncbi:MAG: cytochrome c3 family protein [Symploca sp. SIO3C6]|nr:cytochrome c3 family protein [Symploca sp. SIO3C6]